MSNQLYALRTPAENDVTIKLLPLWTTSGKDNVCIRKLFPLGLETKVQYALVVLIFTEYP